MKTVSNTIRDALAFTSITQHANGLHMDTRLALYQYSRYWDRVNYPNRARLYIVLTDEGAAIASEAPLAKAHAYLVERGFKLDARTWPRIRINHMRYTNLETGASAFTGRHGAVYMDCQPDHKPWQFVQVADFGPKRRARK